MTARGDNFPLPIRLRANARTKVEKATVMLVHGGAFKGGQGVLVGNRILTVAHCVQFSTRGGMTLGDPYLGHIRTSKGRIMATLEVVEPISDIAVLSSVDNQYHPKEAEKFETFCEETTPLRLCYKNLKPLQRLYVYTHRKRWITGQVSHCRRNAPKFTARFDEQIEGGTSGSPVVNDQGELIGLISRRTTSPSEGKYEGMTARPHLALPVWIVNEISGDA